MREVRFGIVGIGNMGRAHAQWLSEGKVRGARLTALCDLVESRTAGFEGVARFTDSSQLISSGKVDAVLVATPHYSHTTIAAAALRAGLHVLCEKPLSVHKRDCERLLQAHTNPAQMFGLMFQMRTGAVYQKVRELIRGGELGQIDRVAWTITDWFRPEIYYSSGGWRATWAGEGGGILLNQCPHNLDLLTWFFGKPEKVRGFCRLGRWHQIEVEDDVTAYLEFPGGATAVFTASTGEAPGTNRLEVAGDKGKLVLEAGKLFLTRNKVGTREFSCTSKEPFSGPPNSVEEIVVSTEAAAHNKITQNFVNAILSGEELLVPAREGLASVELANAILLSSYLGITLTMPLDGAQYEEALKKWIASSTLEKKVVDVAVGDFSKSWH